MRWVDMRKGVAYLFRYREVSLAANSRYLAALEEVDNPNGRDPYPGSHHDSQTTGPETVGQSIQPARTR